MSQLLPQNTTIGDLCTAALQECGRVGVGQTPLADDVTKAWARAQWMLQQWERKRWLVYHLVTYSKVATGQISYTFGPGGEINTNISAAYQLESIAQLAGGLGYAIGDLVNLVSTPPAGAASPAAQVKVTSIGAGGAIASCSLTIAGAYPGPLPNSWTAGGTTGAGSGATFGFPVWGLLPTPITNNNSGSVRPGKLESAFLRQIQISQPNQVDYYMEILQAQEDYNRIALKALQSFPGAVFLDSAWPLGNLFCYPVPQANIYSINLSIREQLPSAFGTLATAINLPYEYYAAILYNLAIRLRPVYQIPTYAGDPLPSLAKESLNVLRGPNTQVARLHMPSQLVRPGIYNIFSDQDY